MPDQTAAASSAMGDLANLGREVQRLDPDRFLCAMTAPASLRPGLIALLAFNQEIAKVRDSVSEPMLGQIRLQWWREALEGIAEDTPRRHDTVEALAGLHRQWPLPMERLQAMIDAREFDLEDRPPADAAEMNRYLDETAGALNRLWLDWLWAGGAVASGGDQETARVQATSVARGYGLIGLLRALPYLARARRVMLPLDLCRAHGTDPDEIAETGSGPKLCALSEALVGQARTALTHARQQGRVPKTALSVMLQAQLAEGYARRLAQVGHDPFALQVRPQAPWRPARLLWAGLRNRF